MASSGHDLASVMWIVGMAGLLALGVVILWVGWRGKRIDDHPICRKCGFDLVGLPTESLVCSECGSDVKSKTAVRLGHRQKRMGWIAGGLAMVLLGGMGTAAVGWVMAKGVDLQQYKPVWWLVNEAKGTDPAKRDRAIAELKGRIASGKISRGQAEEIAAEALARQEDPKRPWAAGWGELLEAAQDAGLLGKKQWKQYVMGIASVELRARAKVRRGDAVPVHIVVLPGRAGTRERFSVRLEGRGMKLAGLDMPRFGNGVMEGSAAAGSLGWTVEMRPEQWEKLKDGAQSAAVPVGVVIKDSRSGLPVVDEVRDLAAKWELVGRDAQTVTLVKDPTLRANVENALRVKQIRAGTWTPGYLEMDIECRQPGVPLGFDVLVRAGDKQWKVGTVCFASGSHSQSGINMKLPGDFAGQKVDVVLRPSAEAAMRSIDMTEIWDGEVIIRDAAVEWPKK